MQSTGTHSLVLLAQSLSGSALENIGQIAPALQAELDAHNEMVNQAIQEVAAPTTAREEAWGGGSDGEFVEIDEFSATETQLAGTPSAVAYPLRQYQFRIGWTRKFLAVATPADVVQAQLNTQVNHLKLLRREMRRALFYYSNVSAFRDKLVDRKELTIRRLLNADSSNIPVGPDGTTFNGATHDHYNANATLTTAAVDAAITDVIEHGHGADMRIYINTANEAAFRGLTGFTAYLDARIIGANNANQATGTLDVSRQNNRAIGIYSGCEVWCKEWIPANYLFVFAAADPRKPLKYRQPTQSALQGLQLAGQASMDPMLADSFEANFGFGAWTRTNGAVLRFDNGAYADPSI